MPLPAPSQEPDNAQLREIVARFCSAYEKKDLEQLMALWSDRSPERTPAKERLQQLFAAKNQISLRNMSIRQVAVDGVRAAVRVVIEETSVDGKSGNAAPEQRKANWTFHCISEAQRWRIWKHSSSEEELAARLVEANTENETRALLEAEADLVSAELIAALNEIGRGLANLGKYDRAATAYGISLRLAERLGDSKLAARALNAIGESYRSQNKYAQALQYHQQSLKLSEEIGDKAGISLTLNSLGNIHSLQDKNAEALEDYGKGLKIAEEIDFKPGILRALYNMGRINDLQGKPVQALEYYQRSLKVAEAIDYHPGVAIILNGIGIIFRSQGNYSQALEYYTRSLKLAEKLGNKESVSGALNNIGIIHNIQGRPEEALDYFQKSLKIAEEIGFKQGMSSALNNIGPIHAAQGNYVKALEYYERSLKISEAMAHKEGIYNTLNNIGLIHKSQDNYPQALEYLQNSLKIAEEIGFKMGVNNALINIGIIRSSQGNSAQALECYQKALKIAEEIGNKAGIRAVLVNIGNVHSSQGNYGQALSFYQRALTLAEEMGDREGVSAGLDSIGIIHSSQGNYSQALDYHQKSLRISEEIGHKVNVSSTLIHIGISHYQQGNSAQALEYYQKGLRAAEETGGKVAIASALNNLGTSYRSQGSYAKALEYFGRSLKISQEIGDQRGVASSLNNIAELRKTEGNFLEAIEFAKRAGSTAASLGVRESYWRARSTAGEAYRLLNRSDEAREAFDDAIATIEDWRDQIAGGEQHKERFFEERIAPYYEMADLLIDRNELAEAFACAERAKARVLLEVLQSGRNNIAKSMTGQELERERNLQSESVALNSLIYKERVRKQPDQQLLAKLGARLEKARLELEAFYTGLYAAHPELRVRRGQHQPITIGSAGSLIGNAKTALLEFVVMKDKSYLFLLTKDGTASTSAPKLNVYKIGAGQKELTSLCQQFRGRLANRSITYGDLAGKLYDLLLKPAFAQLEDRSNLIIVPDGPLWELPFQALKSSQGRFLIEDHTIAYAPSLTALKEMYAETQSASTGTRRAGPLLAFGNPVVDPKTVKQVKSLFMDEELLPLPEAERQVNRLAKLYGITDSKVYVGAEATEDKLKSEAPKCRILHLATHSIVNEASPLYSQVVLAQPKQGGSEDGLLEAWEIMNLDIKADLVVLSACETARGRVGAGEGMIGLSWAFFVAGCPSSVVSQWKIEAASTTELMIEFHKGLKAKLDNPRSVITKADALRHAQLKLFRSATYRHPFYWAGFIITGDAR
jgi:tetratricopeptide (TPR) repeat protein